MLIGEFYEKVFQLSDETLIQKLMQMTEISFFKKGEIIVRQDETPSKIYFLLDGVFRGFFFDAHGKEITDCFGFEMGAAAISCLGIGNPSPIAMEALTECQVLSIPCMEIMKLMEEHLELVAIYNQMLLIALKKQWEIKSAMYQYDAKERYLWFLDYYPGVIERISNKYVAAFLGISPVTLSRLRRSIREEGFGVCLQGS